MEWPEPVERVASVMRRASVEARIEEFGEGTPTAEDAARAAGCSLAQIVKTLVFNCDGWSILVLVPGHRRADAAKVARAAGGTNARPAAVEEVEPATGFPPGAVAPFPARRVERVLIDRSLLVHEVVWIGAGSPKHLAALAPSDLVRLAKAEAVDVVREEES